MGGSAHLRWVSENSKHRRPATRQRGIHGSTPEQFPLDTAQSGMPPEDGRLEIVREGLPVRAPAESAEPHQFRGPWRLCQSAPQPRVSVARRNGNPPRRDYHQAAPRRVRQRINLIPTPGSHGPAAKQEKCDIGAEIPADLDQPVERNLAICEPQQPEQRGSSIARSSAQSALRGNSLSKLRANAAPDPQFPAEGVECAVHQIRPGRLRRQARVAADLQLDPA